MTATRQEIRDRLALARHARKLGLIHAHAWHVRRAVEARQNDAPTRPALPDGGETPPQT